MKFTVLRHRLAKRLILNHRTVEHFLYPHKKKLTTTSLKDYFLEFLLTNTSHPTLNKKSQDIIKCKKKKQFEERKQASEPNSDMTKMLK